MHTPFCSEVYGKCSVTGDRIVTMQWWMASDSFMCVCIYVCVAIPVVPTAEERNSTSVYPDTTAAI